MSAFKAAFDNMQSSSSAPNLSIRGQGQAANPSARGITNALRSAGIGGRPGAARGAGGGAGDGMEIDSGAGAGATAGRPARGKQSRVARADPMSQANRQGGRNNQRRNSDSLTRGALADRIGGGAASGRGGTGGMVADQLLQRGRGSGPSGGRGGRGQGGTPPILRKDKNDESKMKREQAGRVTEVFKTPEFEAWLKGRYRGNGAMDMSNLTNDPFLKDHNIQPIGSRSAATNIGILFWRLIQVKIQDVYEPIRHLSLNDNNLSNLRQLERLPIILSQISALDLSNNPIHSVHELAFLLASAEKKGKANAGVGSLKNLTELKLVGCKFREEMLAKPGGVEHYKHEILRRFPGLRLLDGEPLMRVIFPVDRQPKQVYDQPTRDRLAALPYTYPFDVNMSFPENPILHGMAMEFCQKFFPLWDNSRQALLPAYAPSATFTISANPTPSRSLIATNVETTRHERPRSAPFTSYVELPSRNFLRAATSIETRMETLKSAAQPDKLVEFWKKVPGTVHPLTDGTKWAFDSWILDEWVDGASGEARASAILSIEGEFQELDGNKCYRSFSRTFVLVTVAPSSPAAQAGWPCQILSDTLIVHPYLSNAQFGPNEALRSLRGNGVTIEAPAAVPTTILSAPASGGPDAEPFAGLTPEDIQKAQQLMSATNMNAQWSVMCLRQNEGDYERALANFGEIRGTIPAEAFQS